MDFKLLGCVGLAVALTACAGKPNNTGSTGGNGAVAQETGVTPGSEADLVANVGDRVYFGFNRNTLSSDAQSTLDKQSEWLARYPQATVQVAGNCDDRGTEEYNIALGQRRANAARDYLVAKGVSSSRLSTISYGKDRPTAQGDNEESWSQNRNSITSVQ